jgi:hypothetical protein
MVAAAVWPVLTIAADDMAIILCPLGAGCATAPVAIARRAEHDDAERPGVLAVVGRLLASPLRAACV